MKNLDNFLNKIDLAILFQEKIQATFQKSNVLNPELIERRQDIVYTYIDNLDVSHIKKLVEVCDPSQIKFKIEPSRFSSLTIRFYE